MDQVMEMAKELGKLLQADARYAKFRAASERNDQDEELQELIFTFHMKRQEQEQEAQQDNPDNERIAALEMEMQKAYADIMENETWGQYQEARAEFEALLDQINQVIAYSASGMDPETYDPETCGGCSGGCDSCGGCCH